ncbi:MAG: anti-sigma factor [Acidobacteria bacterium]|nr:anti-sigma factor [Acidobacteriota bacterium]
MTEPTSETAQNGYDVAGPYALGALTEEQRAAFDAHLEVSRASVDEVLAVLPVAHRLAYTAPPRTVPPNLRERTLKAATGSAPSPAPTPAAGRAPKIPAVRPPAGSAPRGGRRWPLVAALLVAVVAAVGLGGFARQQASYARALQENLDEANRRATMAELDVAAARREAMAAGRRAAVLTAPDTQEIVLGNQPNAPDARARVFWSAAEGVVFTASGMPPLAPGQSYHLWLVPDASPVSGGELPLDEEGRIAAVVTLPEGVTEPVPMAVTAEPAGGGSTPTGTVFLLGRPAA